MLKSVLIFLWCLLSGRDRKRQMVALGWDWAGAEQAERARVVERIVEVNMVQREDIRGRQFVNAADAGGLGAACLVGEEYVGVPTWSISRVIWSRRYRYTGIRPKGAASQWMVQLWRYFPFSRLTTAQP